MSNNEEFEKLELHFELTYINNRNVKDIVNQWQQIYDTAPHEAFWTLIQMFLDSTGYMGIRVDQSSENFSVKNMNAILNRIPMKNYAIEKSIMYSSQLREKFSLLIRDIILANREVENFFETYIKTIIVFLFQLTTKGEVFYTTGSIILMKLMYTLLEVGRDYPGNGLKNMIKKCAPRVLAHLENSFEYQDCVQIMYTLFTHAFDMMEYSCFEISHLKKVFLKILTIADSNITSKILVFIKNILEKDQPVTDKLYKLKLLGSKEIMLVLLHHSVGTNKRIAVTALEIVNSILNNSEKNYLTQHDYTPLLFRMYDSNAALRKLAGITFQILHYESQSIIEKMITFYLQYPPKYHENITYLVDACFMPNQLDRHINELIEILCQQEMPDEYKIVGGQILQQLFKNILREYTELSSNLFERLPELLLASQLVPHVTLNLLEVVSDTIDANASIIIPIIKHLIELVTTHKDYDILCAANTALYKLSKQRENLFKEQTSYRAVVQSIYNAYNLSRIIMHEELDTYKICLIRFRAASEFTEFVSDYFGEPIHDILDTLFSDLTSQDQDVNDTIREHQIVLYTTLVSAEYKRQLDTALFERTAPFLQHIVTMLADFADDSEPNILLTHAVIPGICMFYIMASRPIDLAKNADRIKDIPSYIYGSIADVLTKMSATLSKTENNVRIMKTLLTYWVNLHKVQKIPNIPKANTILILYGNVEQLFDPLEELMMSLHDYTTDHILLITNIGESFLKLGMVDKVMAKNYTNSLYKFLVRIAVKNEEADLLTLLTSILIYILCIMELKLKTNNREKANRLLPFNYLNNYVKRLVGNKRNDQIIKIINRILQFETISQGETNTLNNIKTQLEK